MSSGGIEMGNCEDRRFHYRLYLMGLEITVVLNEAPDRVKGYLNSIGKNAPQQFRIGPTGQPSTQRKDCVASK